MRHRDHNDPGTASKALARLASPDVEPRGARGRGANGGTALAVAGPPGDATEAVSVADEAMAVDDLVDRGRTRGARGRARRGKGLEPRSPNARVRFAYVDLADTERLVGLVLKAEASGVPSHEVLPQVAGTYDMRETSLRRRIQSASLFGLVTSEKGVLRTTALGRRLGDPSTRGLALARAFANVPLNAMLVRHYEGRVATRGRDEPEDVMDAQISMVGVSAKSHDGARRAVVRSARQADWVDEETGRFRNPRPDEVKMVVGARVGTGVGAAPEATPTNGTIEGGGDAEGEVRSMGEGAMDEAGVMAVGEARGVLEVDGVVDLDVDPAAPELFREIVDDATTGGAASGGRGDGSPDRDVHLEEGSSTGDPAGPGGEARPDDEGGEELEAGYGILPATLRDDEAVLGRTKPEGASAEPAGDGGGGGGGDEPDKPAKRPRERNSRAGEIPRRSLQACLTLLGLATDGQTRRALRDDFMNSVAKGASGPIGVSTAENWVNYTRYFGLISLVGGEGGAAIVQITPIGQAALGEEGEGRRRGLARAFRSVALYGAILRDHEGSVTSARGVEDLGRRMVEDLQVGAKVAPSILNLFVESARTAGFLRRLDGILVDPYPDDAERDGAPARKEPDDEPEAVGATGEPSATTSEDGEGLATTPAEATPRGALEEGAATPTPGTGEGAHDGEGGSPGATEQADETRRGETRSDEAGGAGSRVDPAVTPASERPAAPTGGAGLEAPVAGSTIPPGASLGEVARAAMPDPDGADWDRQWPLWVRMMEAVAAFGRAAKVGIAEEGKAAGGDPGAG